MSSNLDAVVINQGDISAPRTPIPTPYYLVTYPVQAEDGSIRWVAICYTSHGKAESAGMTSLQDACGIVYDYMSGLQNDIQGRIDTKRRMAGNL